MIEVILDTNGDTNLETSVINDLNKLIEGNGIKIIQRRILFSNGPIFGIYEYSRTFQISSLPDNAPKPKFIMGDHPLLLEMKCESTGIYAVDRVRFDRIFRETFLILSLIFWAKLNGFDSSAAHHWAMNINDGTISYQYNQSGYGFADTEWRNDRFSYSYLPNFPKVPANKYYHRIGFDSSYTFDTSDISDICIEKIFGLDSDVRSILIMAIYWLETARSTWSQSRSLAYVALTSAVETLARLESSERMQEFCSKCGQETGQRISQRFVEFIEKYADSSDAAFVKDLYDLRSRIIHGNKLFVSDSRQGDFAIDKFADDRKLEQLLRLSKHATLNWLLSYQKT